MSVSTATVSILTTAQKAEWQSYIEALPKMLQDVYFTCDFYEAAAKGSNSEAVCFVYTSGNDLYVYPFLKTKVSDALNDTGTACYDIEGAYGYNGPAATTSDATFLQNAHLAFSEYCATEHIIAEFTRFNPVLGNHQWASYMQLIKANENIVLDVSEEDIWMNAYEHSTRKNVNKAMRSGLTVSSVSGNDISETQFESFFDIYYQTMDRNKADAYYYFSKDFFSDMCSINNGANLFVFTHAEDKIVSAELVTMGAATAYSFLGGTLPDYFNLRANDILKDGIIKELKQRGLGYYCLGGGTALNDGIFKYKKCFAKNGVKDFFIGKKIHQPELYWRIIANWENNNKTKSLLYKNHLLKYKY